MTAAAAVLAPLAGLAVAAVLSRSPRAQARAWRAALAGAR